MNSLLPNSDLKLKKVGKTSRPFRSNLNQIPYNYTVEVINRFKGFDLIECPKNYGWRFMTLFRRQWSRPSPRKRNAKRQTLVWGGLTNSWVRKRSKRQRRKRKIIIRDIAQLCPTLCDPMDCSLPRSSVHGIFQAKVLEWIAISFSSGSSQTRDQTQVSRIVDRCFTVWATRDF